ncbi:MAG: hypothetical protein ACK5CO_01500, partial [Bacteroidota bacterium]
GKRRFPPRSQNYCSKILKGGYTRIYPDILGYIWIESTLIGIYSHKIVLFILTAGNPGSPSAS